MAQFSTVNADYIARMRKVIEPKLFDTTKRALHWMETVDGGELKRNAGGLTLEYYQKRDAKASNIYDLTGDPTDVVSHGDSPITKLAEITLQQKGSSFEFSNLAEATDIFKFLNTEIPKMGEDAALYADNFTRNAVVAGMLTEQTMLNRFAGIGGCKDEVGKRAADHLATMVAGSADTYKMTPLVAAGAKTALRLSRAPKYEGKHWLGFISPEQAYDFQEHDNWKHPHQYSNVKQIFNGEIGMLNGFRYIEIDETFYELATLGTFDVTGDVISAFFMGAGAVGAPKFAGTSDPTAPKVTILNKADKSDIHNQVGKAGYDLLWNAKLLRPDWMCQVRSRTTFE